MSQLIMVIDDEAGMRDLICDALKLAGFETIEAPDAMVAQTLLRTTKPDLLIVDINMPMMDGFEFIERIRGNGDNTPALMLSARGDRADITRGLTLGADDYVTKPFGMEELLARIRALLRRAQLVRHAEQLQPLRVQRFEVDLAATEALFRLLDPLPVEYERQGIVRGPRVNKEHLVQYWIRLPLAAEGGTGVRMILGLDYFLSGLEDEARQVSAG